MAMVKNRWKHLKTGSVYEIVGFAVQEGTMDPVVVYRGVALHTLWTRPCQEFFDGRFEQYPGSVKTRPGGDTSHLDKAATNIFADDEDDSDFTEAAKTEALGFVARRDTATKRPKQHPTGAGL